MNKKQVLQDFIEGYRNTISERYQYETIKQQYDIPETINEKTFDTLRNYFLSYIYPDCEKRATLDEAFRSLDEFIKHPQILISILLDASKLIFKYGRHFRKILNTGLKALKSFRAASKFENILIEEAIKNKMEAPFDLAKITQLVTLLPAKEIEEFINTSQSLFETLHDKEQVKKIIEIIEHLIRIMRKKEKLYPATQIEGLEFALAGLKEGNQLFNELNAKNQQLLIALITQIERDWLNLME